jgi:hypothetical protein
MGKWHMEGVGGDPRHPERYVRHPERTAPTPCHPERSEGSPRVPTQRGEGIALTWSGDPSLRSG